MSNPGPASTVSTNTIAGGSAPDGFLVGNSATSTVGAYGVTPVVQPSLAAQAAIPVTGASTGAGALTQYTSTQSPGTGIATITTSEQSITVTGVLATDLVIINKPTSQTGLTLCTGRVSAASTVKLVFANTTTGTLTPTGSEAYLVTTIPVNLQLSAALTPAAVAANTTVEQTFTVTGVDVGMVLAVNKPTTQAGLAVTAVRATAKNTVGITFLNVTAAAITPTAAETYIFGALNGLVATSQIIEMGVNVGTVTGTATITTSEQAITAAGIQAADVMVGISKPTLQAGIAVAGGRVSAASTLQITYVNPTAATVTPTASEVYGVTLFRPSPAAPMTILSSGTITPTSVAANTTAEQTFTVTGLVSGNAVMISPPSIATPNPGMTISQVRISATNTLAITFVNATATAIVPAAGVYTIGVFNMIPSTAGGYVQTLVTPMATLGVSLMNATRAALVATGWMAGS